MAGRSPSRAEELTKSILAELYAQEIAPQPHPALIHYSPDQVKKVLMKHLTRRCLSMDDGEITSQG